MHCKAVLTVDPRHLQSSLKATPLRSMLEVARSRAQALVLLLVLLRKPPLLSLATTLSHRSAMEQGRHSGSMCLALQRLK